MAAISAWRITNGLFNRYNPCAGTVVVARCRDDQTRVGEVEECKRVEEVVPEHGQVNRTDSQLGVERTGAQQTEGITFAGTGDRRALGLGTVELATHGEHGVTHRLGLEPALAHPPDQNVIRVDLVGPGVEPGIELIGATEHELADQCLDRPAVLHERDSQVVEQLGMARRLPGCPEVVGRRDQSATEQMQPDAVDHDAGGERVLRRRQPVRQLEPAAPLTDFGDAAW